MRHLTEDEIVFHHYGDLPDAAQAAEHLAACGECRSAAERLKADLALLERLPVPERGESYGRELWARLRPSLASKPTAPSFFPGWRPWVLSASLAALLAVAFLAGRVWPRGPESANPSEQLTRGRILAAAVADHLDRSQIVLLEFLHGDPAADSSGGHETRLAEELVSANRLYRQTAARAGERGVTAVLDELERVLLEIAHSPTPEAREALKRRIESEGTLFKVRVLRSELDRREKAATPPPASRT